MNKQSRTQIKINISYLFEATVDHLNVYMLVFADLEAKVLQFGPTQRQIKAGV